MKFNRNFEIKKIDTEFRHLDIPSPTWSRTRGSSKPTDKSGKNSLQTWNQVKDDAD